MKPETKHVENWESKEYRFEVWRQGRTFYANAATKDAPGVWIHKWTRGRTLKGVRGSIEAFDGDARIN